MVRTFIAFVIWCTIVFLPFLTQESALASSVKSVHALVKKAEDSWLRQDFSDVQVYANSVLEVDGEHVDGLYWAGRYAQHMMMDQINQGRRVEHPDVVSWRDEAIGYFARVLNQRETHRPSLLALGLVYYEGGLPDRMVGLFEAERQRKPNEAEAYFMICLGLQRQGETGQAYGAFAHGLRYVQDGYLQASLSLLGDEDVLAGWRSRDPFFLTGVNERLKEHFSRVVYAEMRFGNSIKNIHGMHTDQGEMFVRFGPPLTRHERTRAMATYQLWDYGDFQLAFYEIGGRGNWVLQWAVMDQVEYVPKDFLLRKPERYVDPYQWRRFGIPVQVGQFRGADGLTRLEVFLGIPDDQVFFEAERVGLGRVNLQKGIFLFDDAWQARVQNVSDITHMPWLDGNNLTAGQLLWSEKVDVAPGNYHFAVEASDNFEAALGQYLDDIDVIDFGGESLKLSSLVLARNIRENADRPFGRGQFTILPNPSKKFTTTDRVGVYFEAYNLSRGPDGKVNGEALFLIGREGDGWQVVKKELIQGIQNWTPKKTMLTAKSMGAGLKTLRVRVNDLVSGQVAETETTFRVAW